MRIVTDSKTVAEPKDPATCNVFALYTLFATNTERETMAAHYRAGGLGYGEVKQALFDKFWTAFEPFRRRREELQKDPERVEQILQSGATRAREELRKTLKAARRAVGLE
jgi:tryptophanyl-tRNA synthetase